MEERYGRRRPEGDREWGVERGRERLERGEERGKGK